MKTGIEQVALVLCVFLPLLAACWVVLAPPRWRWPAVVATLAGLPLLLLPLAAAVQAAGPVVLALGGHEVPLGIRLRLDGLSLLMLALLALAGGLAGVHALASHPPASDAGGRFWPLWLLMTSGLAGLSVSADLFNLYVMIELVTLSGIALLASGGEPGALRAAMRYLLLALLASLAYLLGVALLYGEHGVLDLYLLGGRMDDASVTTPTALALIAAGLLLKAAVFPLHVWLPPAHAQAPGAVSAVLSALVVKAALYLLLRIGFWTADELGRGPPALLLGLLGAGAVLFGSAAALVQSQIKRVVAYSTVAQLGYVLLAFPLLAEAVSAPSAWAGTGYQMLSHGLAKAGMFLAAANLVRGLGSGRIDRLAGADRLLPTSLFAFGLAGISLMGLPPSGGFLAKWMLLEAAWAQRGWGWLAVLMLGSLLAAGYVFRVLAAAFLQRPGAQEPTLAQPVSRAMSVSALLLGLSAIVLGFVSAPVLELFGHGAPPDFLRGVPPGGTP